LSSGRRVIYDFDNFGDSPACLSKTEPNLEGKIAFAQGYGADKEGKNLGRHSKVRICLQHFLMFYNSNLSKLSILNIIDIMQMK
jgi:hypothetical protein